MITNFGYNAGFSIEGITRDMHLHKKLEQRSG